MAVDTAKNWQSLPVGWENQVLAGIGAPQTGPNRLSLDVWAQSEQSPDLFNPFNTTRAASGPGTTPGTPTNSAGVRSFSDWQSGLAATVQTLDQQNFAGIKAALQQQAPVAQFETAVSSSPWGTKSFVGSFTPSPESPGVAGAILPSLGNALNPANYGSDISQTASTIGGGIASLGSDAFSSALKSLANSGLLLRGTLIVAGLIILFIGISQLGKANQGPGETVGGGTENVTVRIAKAAKKTATSKEAGPEEVAA